MWFGLNNLLSPKKFVTFADRSRPYLSIIFLITFTYGLIGGLFLAPADYLQGDGFRIIYVHAPCAFLSLFIYAVMAYAAFLALVWRIKLGTMIIQASAKIGAGFTLLALITGSIWGKPMWGTWWIWDARLTSELILLFLYLGILFFQASIADRNQGDRALAILVLIGAIDLPIIHYSVYWWNTLHQGATLKIFSPSSIDQSMLYPLLAMIIAFLCYYGILLSLSLSHDYQTKVRES